MNSMQPFGYTGEPNTCKWCGRKLGKKPAIVTGGRHFHAESCATQFGAAAANIGVVFKADADRSGLIVGQIVRGQS